MQTNIKKYVKYANKLSKNIHILMRSFRNMQFLCIFHANIQECEKTNVHTLGIYEYILYLIFVDNFNKNI